MTTFKLSQSFENSPSLCLREKSSEFEERCDSESSDFNLETNSFSHLSMKEFYSYDSNQKTPAEMFTNNNSPNFTDPLGCLASAEKVYNCNHLNQGEINFSSSHIQENSGDHSERGSVSSSRLSITSQKSTSANTNVNNSNQNITLGTSSLPENPPNRNSPTGQMAYPLWDSTRIGITSADFDEVQRSQTQFGGSSAGGVCFDQSYHPQVDQLPPGYSDATVENFPHVDEYLEPPAVTEDSSTLGSKSPGKMSGIENLSDELLSRIFVYMNWGTLFQILSLVCRRWYKIIDNDPYLGRFKKLSMKINSKDLDFQKTFISKRDSLRSISIRFVSDFEYVSTYKFVIEDFLTLLGRTCRNLADLSIEEYDWKLMSQPVPWIRSELFPNLTVLRLENISFTSCMESSFQSIASLRFLKKLVLVEEQNSSKNSKIANHTHRTAAPPNVSGTSQLLTGSRAAQNGAKKSSGIYKQFFEAVEFLIRELCNLEEVQIQAVSDDAINETILKNFVRNLIESNNPIGKISVNNIDKWVLTLTGCEMMQMVTTLRYLKVHTLSFKTDKRVLQNLLVLFSRIKSLSINIEDSLMYSVRLNMEHQTFPNIESLEFSASCASLSLVKCFPKVRHLVCLPKLDKIEPPIPPNQDSRVILKHIHKALTQFNVAFFSDLETVQMSRTYLLLYRYCERVHPKYMHKLRKMTFINDTIYLTFTAFSSHLKLPDGPELLSALRRRFSNTTFSILTNSYSAA